LLFLKNIVEYSKTLLTHPHKEACMIRFRITKKSERSRARLGILETPHGTVETPAFVPVATAASLRTLTSEEAAEAGSQLFIANTFHLHVRPGEEIVRNAGGIHRFMNWKRPLMTDSGGFQVFSLGFGRDFDTGKFSKDRTAQGGLPEIKRGRNPSSLKITDDGAEFRSPLDGRKLFIGPRESIAIQEAIGADMIFAFDECTPAHASRGYIEHSLARTHRWAKDCLAAKKSEQALFGIVQGSHFEDLRKESAGFIGALPFDGFGIGGDLGDIKESKREMFQILEWTVPLLPDEKPRHLLGIGYPEDMEPIITHGIDLFDCITPTHFARRGVAFTREGRLNLRQKRFLSEFQALDDTCACGVCGAYSRAYIAHLIRAREITGLRLLTYHNLFFWNTLVARLREKIARGEL